MIKQRIKKAPRLQAKKKQTPTKTPTARKENVKEPEQLIGLLQDQTVAARTIVDFIVGPNCGLERKHKTYDNATSFLLAVKADRLDVVQLLLSEYSPNTKAVDHWGRNALHCAILRENAEMVRYLMEVVDVVDATDSKGDTPLHLSVFRVSNSMALLLLEYGANVNNADEFSNSPLHNACARGLDDIVLSLLANGAPVDAVSFGLTPLDVAIDNGHTNLVSLLQEDLSEGNFVMHNWEERDAINEYNSTSSQPQGSDDDSCNLREEGS